MRHRKNLSYLQELEDALRFSHYRPLVMFFIATAVEVYADHVAASDPADFNRNWLNGKAWVGVAKDIQAAIDKLEKRQLDGWQSPPTGTASTRDID